MAKQSKPKAPPPPAMSEIEVKAKAVADIRAALAKNVAILREGLRKVTDRHIVDLRDLSAQLGVAHQELLDLVKGHPELFEKPRSAAFHGITVGFSKGKGRMTYDNPEAVIALIEKKLPDRLDALAPSSRSLSHKALEGLEAKALKAIGVSITDDGDKAYVKTPADDVDKFTASIVAAHSVPEAKEILS